MNLIQTTLSPGPGGTYCVRGGRQVLLNWRANARDAMPDGGALTISASNHTLDEHYAVVLPEEFGDADLLVVKCQTHPSFGAIIMGLPRKWLENPDLEAKVTLAAQHFGSCVEISISEQARLGIPPIRKVETKKAG